MTCIFDQKFGEDFVSGVPHSPGVYRFFNRDGELVYVGKAKDLRRRLSQYRTPKRVKAHRKMKRIVKASVRLEFEVTASEKDALLLENALIQQHRPRLNVAGAFSFLYPSIGFKRDAHHVHLALSTKAEALATHEFRLFGCYRNRSITKAGFEALSKVLGWLGHAERAPERVPYTTWQRFRQIPKGLDVELAGFLLGESEAFLEAAILQLLEKPVARRHAADVQECMESLKLFFDTECRKLKSLREELDIEYIAQEERDRASIRAEP